MNMCVFRCCMKCDIYHYLQIAERQEQCFLSPAIRSIQMFQHTRGLEVDQRNNVIITLLV